ncbi:hypothetical protein ONE63_002224 [Megalurothrips usitatus]|uniref:Uncharacterized protein n=1 Tax=Megalurothrips usitatus TaxID=439358 RepID=A0AAV7XE46_9NEOP|nr:hypothetical protein ONE63_002224 [Megalurothrips usitatus]
MTPPTATRRRPKTLSSFPYYLLISVPLRFFDNNAILSMISRAAAERRGGGAITRCELHAPGSCTAGACEPPPPPPRAYYSRNSVGRLSHGSPGAVPRILSRSYPHHLSLSLSLSLSGCTKTYLQGRKKRKKGKKSKEESENAGRHKPARHHVLIVPMQCYQCLSNASPGYGGSLGAPLVSAGGPSPRQDTCFCDNVYLVRRGRVLQWQNVLIHVSYKLP